MTSASSDIRAPGVQFAIDCHCSRVAIPTGDLLDVFVSKAFNLGPSCVHFTKSEVVAANEDLTTRDIVVTS